ncbi:MAG TPA: septal ring lytic transglycosylase RlpA family protein [Candidatus Binatia bacterium]|jgi:rare lipoprotein A|nr:septal ring lytic transglycosylase RlpA family protein [Candidatus Binatia bacterium]
MTLTLPFRSPFLLVASLFLACSGLGADAPLTGRTFDGATYLADSSPQPPAAGLASWYGEEHRGKLMANGQPFDPDKLTAASWFYPFGTKVRVTLESAPGTTRSVVVTITDRGPERRLVLDGRVIDLARAAFEKLAPAKAGLVRVTVQPAT